MRYLHCTQRLIKEIDPSIKSKGEERDVFGLGDWYANAFWLDDSAYIIFTNVKTLYSFVVPDVYDVHVKNITYTFTFGLEKSLKGIGLKNSLIERILDEYSDFKVVKTNSRSVLATMNDHINQFAGRYEVGGIKTTKDVDEFNKNILDLPSGAMKYKTPKKMFYELIENEFVN